MAAPGSALLDFGKASIKERTAAANALFDRLAAVRVKAGLGERSLFQAMRDAALTYGPSRTIVEDSITGALTYRELLAGARMEIISCLAYSPSGRVQAGDVRIAGNEVTEGYVGAILDPGAHAGELRSEDAASAYAHTIASRAGEVDAAERARIGRARDELKENGRPVETYRRIGLDEALGLL